MSEKSPFGFAAFVPGFEFLQDLTRQTMAASAGGAGPAGAPGLGQWVAPTFNVEELDKRIQELKTVQFWLEQNARALAATVQALEVQKMTLSALRDMNVSLGDVAESMKVKPMPTEPAPAPAPSFKPAEPAEPKAAASGAPAAAGDPAAPSASPPQGTIDPMQWWSALSQQFQTIASQAVQDVARAVPPTTPAAGKKRAASASSAPAKGRGTSRARAAPSSAKTTTTGRSSRSGGRAPAAKKAGPR